MITRYRHAEYNLNVMRQSVRLVFNPIMVDNYAAFLNCTSMGQESDSLMAPLKVIHFSWVRAGASCLLLGPPGLNWCSAFAPELVSFVFHAQGSPSIVVKQLCHKIILQCIKNQKQTINLLLWPKKQVSKCRLYIFGYVVTLEFRLCRKLTYSKAFRVNNIIVQTHFHFL